MAPTTGILVSSSTRPSMLPAGNALRLARASFAGACADAGAAPSTNVAIAAAGIHRIIIPRPTTPARRPALFQRLRHGERNVPRNRLTVGLIGHLNLEPVIAGLERVFHRNPLADK